MAIDPFGGSGTLSGTGVNQSTINVNAGGINGLFGQKQPDEAFTAGGFVDPNFDADKQGLNAAMQSLQGQHAPQMQAAQIGQVAGLPTDNRQMMSQLGQTLMASANGDGPSAAQAQMGLATDANMQNALALAASAPGHGGNFSAAMKQAGTQRAAIQQQAALQGGQLRAQEMQAAQGQLGQLGSIIGNYDLGARGQDLNTALSQAQLNQQAGAQNLQAQQAQQQQTNELMKQYMAMGLSQDQAYYQAIIQQRQFNAGLLAQQKAAGEGVGVQSAGQAMQLAGAGASGLGSALSSSVAKGGGAAAIGEAAAVL